MLEELVEGLLGGFLAVEVLLVELGGLFVHFLEEEDALLGGLEGVCEGGGGGCRVGGCGGCGGVGVHGCGPFLLGVGGEGFGFWGWGSCGFWFYVIGAGEAHGHCGFFGGRGTDACREGGIPFGEVDGVSGGGELCEQAREVEDAGAFSGGGIESDGDVFAFAKDGLDEAG